MHLLPVHVWRGSLIDDRHGSRRNRSTRVDAASNSVVGPDDPIAISTRLSFRPATAAEMPGAGTTVDDDSTNRAAHALTKRRSTALPWRPLSLGTAVLLSLPLMPVILVSLRARPAVLGISITRPH